MMPPLPDRGELFEDDDLSDDEWRYECDDPSREDEEE